MCQILQEITQQYADNSYDAGTCNQYEEINNIWDTLSDELEKLDGDKNLLMEAFMQLLGLVRDLTEDMNEKVE